MDPGLRRDDDDEGYGPAVFASDRDSAERETLAWVCRRIAVTPAPANPLPAPPFQGGEKGGKVRPSVVSQKFLASCAI